MITYRFNPHPVVTWPVEVAVPVDGGAVERQSFTATFRLLPRAERLAITTEDFEGLQAFLRQVWVGADLLDADGAPLAWDDGLRDAVLELDFVVQGLLTAYARAINGIDRKN